MRKVKLFVLSVFAVAAFGLSSCKKCSECHYEKADTQIELGEYCDEDLENIEKDGYHDHNTDTTYEVHCHEH